MTLPEKKSLSMTFDPNVIDDLGAKLYSTLPPIISELVANGYDACSKKVEIELYNGDPEDKKIVIRDYGHGMSYDQVDDEYLVVGRKKRESEEPEDDPSRCKRKPIGKKGLGKLAFFGIARTGQIETVQDGKKVTFTMDLDAIHNSANGNYEPDFKEEDAEGQENGTTITLTGIYRKTDFDVEGLSRSLSNYFIFDKDFKVFIKSDDAPDYDEINNEQRYQQEGRSEEFAWEFPETALNPEVKQFSFSGQVSGRVILFDKPVRSNMRGVTLFSRKKLVNLPEFFPVQGSGYFFQYLTGWLEVDFIDDFIPDVISTNRSSLAWNDNNLLELREFLEEIIRYITKEWRKLKAAETKKEIKDKFDIDPDAWKESNKNNPVIKENIEKLLPKLKDPETLPSDQLMDIVEIVHNLAPEHADFMLWRNLNQTLKDNEIIKEKFFAGKYLEAAREAVQLYEAEVQTITGNDGIGQALMSEVFGADTGKAISVTDRANESKRNIEEGQKFLSMGIMTGFKNPAVSHTSITEDLRNGNFTNRDCLDILSTISYLYSRLENRTQP